MIMERGFADIGLHNRNHKEWLAMGTLRATADRKKKKELINNSRTRTSKATTKTSFSEAHKKRSGR